MCPDIRIKLDFDGEAWTELDDIYEALDKKEKITIFWWILEDVFDDVKNQLKNWFEDDK